MHILFATPEVAPFAKTGGLADVSRSLPAALKLAGVEITIITPLYDESWIDTLQLAERLTPLRIPLDGDEVVLRVYEGRTPENVRTFFLAHDKLFARTPIYGPKGGAEYADNGIRFGIFSAAVCEFIRVYPIPVDLIHCNEWQTAMVPVFLEESYHHVDKLATTAVVVTVHNVALQGRYKPEVLKRLGLPASLYHPQNLEFFGDVSYLKGGILYTDSVTTVSPTYAREIATSDLGGGLEGVLEEREEDLLGIMNGVDYAEWDPTTDPHLYQRYDGERMNGKRMCKSALQKETGLPIRPTVPLLGFVGSLVEQSGLDIISDCLDDLMELGVQIVFLGEGEPHYEKAILEWADEFPQQIAARVEGDESMTHWMIAGVDALLMPSRYEPCGQVQLFAQRYGTVPVARRTGGLADSIQDVDGTEGTGFLFDEYDADALFDAITTALDYYKRARDWRVIQLNGMKQSFSWTASAAQYQELYRQLIIA